MVIAHEMAHMWFGNLVTMRWWNDVWLSESFATYMGFQVLAEATAFTGTWTDFALAHKTRGYDADQRESTHPVAPDPGDVPDTDAARSSYDDISYAKGASALRQLVAWLGWPAFLAGINDYFARYRFGCATLPDLLDCLSPRVRCRRGRVGRALAAQLRRGHPDGRPAGAARPGLVHQSRRPTGRTACGSGCTTRHRESSRSEPGYRCWCRLIRVRSCYRRGRPEPALLLPNDGDFSYCKVRLDPASQAALASWMGRLADPLSRAVAWNAVRDLVRDSELAPRQYLGLAVRHLPAETDSSIAQHVIAYARWTVADRYLPPGLRGAALADITSLCRDLLSPPGNADGSGAWKAAWPGRCAGSWPISSRTYAARSRLGAEPLLNRRRPLVAGLDVFRRRGPAFPAAAFVRSPHCLYGPVCGTVCDVEPQRQVREGDLLWTPGPDRVSRANVTAFARWLARERGPDFARL